MAPAGKHFGSWMVFVVFVGWGWAQSDAVVRLPGMRTGPVAQVIDMLETLQVEAREEGNGDKSAFSTGQCACQESSDKLKKQIASGTSRANELEGAVKELLGSNSQLSSELDDLRLEIADNRKTLQAAAAQRLREATAFVVGEQALRANIRAVEKAGRALEAGAPAQLTQLRGLLRSSPVRPSDVAVMAVFLQVRESDARQGSAELIGILRQLQAGFEDDLNKARRTESSAAQRHAEVVAAKETEARMAVTDTASREARLSVGKSALASAVEEQRDTRKSMATSKTVWNRIVKGCALKVKEYEVRKRQRQEEVVAIGATIGFLTDAQATSHFKDTFPVAASAKSFVELYTAARQHAHSVQRRAALDSHPAHAFHRIEGEISRLIKNMKQAQEDESSKKLFCVSDLRRCHADVAHTKQELAVLSQQLTERTSAAEGIGRELSVLVRDEASLDATATKAQAQRRQEAVVFATLRAETTRAVALLRKAMRMLKHAYANVLSQEDTLLTRGRSMRTPLRRAVGLDVANESVDSIVGLSFADIRHDARRADADGRVATGGSRGARIQALLIKIMGNLNQAFAQAAKDEEVSARDHQQFLLTSTAAVQAKRQQVVDTEEHHARTAGQISLAKHRMVDVGTRLTSATSQLSSLNDSCGVLLQTYPARQAARLSEMRGLRKTVAVLDLEGK